MEPQDTIILSVDNDNMIVVCSDGEYPLVAGLEDLDTNILQGCMNVARKATMKILEEIDNYAG